MIIRKAIPQDAVIIALLGRITFSETFKHCFQDPGDLQEYLAYTFSVQKISASLEKTNNTYWLAFLDDLPIGYAKLKSISPSDFTELEFTSQLQKIYVLQDFQGVGAGKALLKEIVEAVKDLNNQSLWLSVLKANRKAVQFYETVNFQTIGEHPFSIGKEHFDFSVMECRFN